MVTKEIKPLSRSRARPVASKEMADAQPQRQAGRPTSAELERRKSLVIQVATQLFVNHGYAGTSLVDIAKGAGVATRTLYQHFGDKEAIFRDVLFARDNDLVATPPEVDGSAALFEVLMRTARYAMNVALRERSVQLMRLMISESNRFPEMMSKLTNTIYSRFRQSISRIFQQLADFRLITDGDHDLSAAVFTDLILGNTPIMMYTGWRPVIPDEQDLRFKVEFFIAGRFGVAAVHPVEIAADRSMARNSLLPRRPLKNELKD